MTAIGSALYKLLCMDRGWYLVFGRDIITGWYAAYADEHPGPFKVLDLGCGTCADLLSMKETVHSTVMYGADSYDEKKYDDSQTAIDHGVTLYRIDIEHERIPVEDGFFDVVVSNQTFEHMKDIFWVTSEASRVVKKGGMVIVGVPNLAALHNRIWLLMGEQPSAIEILGPHIRGYTAPGFKRYIEKDGFFKVVDVKGSAFWPFPIRVSQFMSMMFPRWSTSIFFMMVRTPKEGTFIEVLEEMPCQTGYYKGK